MSEPAVITTAEILAARPARNTVDPDIPYAFLVEPEQTAAGRIEDVATIFLTNRECPFRCLMCDLWKNTTTDTVPTGAIPRQIDYALSRLPAASQIKLYNSGNFFDKRAIPPSDHAAIARRLQPFHTVIVENHPRFCTDACVQFANQIDGQLEVAIGLETIHPRVLPRLNKQMTLDDFDRAAAFLRGNDITVRAFILLRPPYLTEQAGIDWAIRSIEHAFSVGVGCCAVIPTRVGNGIMEQLQANGNFTPPTLRSLELVTETGLSLQAGRVFADLWDIENLVACNRCGPRRIGRLKQMNLTQQTPPPVKCECEAAL
jgi:radical SAM enzyme (TIGR01210 family)